MKKSIAKVLAGLMTVSLVSGFNLCYNERVVQAEEKQQGTGLKETTAEEQKWFEENATKVLPNANSKQRSVLPKSVDNSVKNPQTGKTYFPEILSQGSIGSCGPFAATYYQLSYMVNRKYNTDINDKEFKRFSPKWTYNLLNGGYDYGTYSGEVYDLLKRYGACTWQEFPYTGDKTNPVNYREWPRDEAAWRTANNYKVENIKNYYIDPNNTKTPVKTPDSENLTELKSALSKGYVITFSTYFTGREVMAVQTAPDSKEPAKYLNEKIVTAASNDGGHLMTVVGYDDSIWVDINGNTVAEPSEYGALKVANSWGANRSDHNEGFLWYAYDSLNAVSSVPGRAEFTTRTPVFRDGYGTSYDVKDIDPNAKYAKFTIEHNDRSQVDAIFTSEKNSTVTHSMAEIFKYNGNFSFDGTNNKSTGTFVVNVKDLNESLVDNYTLKLGDTVTDNSKLGVKNVEIIDGNGTKVSGVQESLPVEFDGQAQNYKFVENKNLLKTPVLTIDEFGILEDGVYTVNFDGSQEDKRKVYYDLYENDKIARSNRGQQASSGVGSHPIAAQLDGEYKYKLVIEDLLGNKATSNVISAKVDYLKAPKVTIDELWAEKDGHAELNINANQVKADEINYEVYENNKVISNGAMKGTESKKINLYNRKNGSYDYKVKLTDRRGNVEEVKAGSIVVDNGFGNLQEPRIKLNTILSKNKSVIIDLYCGNIDPISSKIEFYQDMKLVTTKKAGEDAPLRFGMGGLTDGMHMYQFKITDATGKVHETEIANVQVTDKFANEPKATIKAAKELSTDGKVSITIDGSNSTKKIRNMMIFENYDYAQNVGWKQSYTHDFGVKKDGVYYYQAILEYEDGTYGDTDMIKVVVDRNAIPTWMINKTYKIGDKVAYNGKHYECTYGHVSQESWNPGATSALWKVVN